MARGKREPGVKSVMKEAGKKHRESRELT